MTTRVLQIIPTLVRGGAEKQLALLAAGLPRERFDVHVFVLTEDGPLRDPLDQAEIPVTLIGKRWKFDPAAYGRLRAKIRSLAPQVVHTWIFAANAYGRYAAKSAGIENVVAGERCIDRWKTWELTVDRYLARCTKRFVTNSSGVRDFYVDQGLPSDRFEVIPNGVAPFSGEPDGQRSALLDELGLPDDAKLIGAVGRLWPQKRYKDLIWAAELLRVIRDDSHLLIVGDGPQRELLQRYTRQVGVDRRVHFLGIRHDVSRLMACFDCFWLGSAYEGQSNAMMEAMSAGVPVVATEIAGNRDLVTDGETGWLVPIGDAAGFASRTNQLLEDPQLAAAAGEAGKRRMRDEFSIERMIERYQEFYERLVAS